MARLEVEEALASSDRLRRQIERLDMGTGSPPKRPFLHDAESAEVIRRVSEHTGPVTFFVGAGASIEADLPSWGALVRNVLEDVPLSGGVDRDEWEATLLEGGPPGAAAIAQARLDNFSRRVYRGLYRGKSSKTFRPGALSEQVSYWKSRFKEDVSIVTVNYDDLLEKALSASGLSAVPVTEAAQTIPDGAVPVFHLHGRLDDESSDGPIVLSEDDYAQFPAGGSWQDELMDELLRTTMCVFVGLSFSDPNLLRWVHSAAEAGPHVHVALFSRQSSPRLSEPVRRALESATRDRWASANVDAFFTDFFGEQAQIIHEAAIGRSGSKLDSFETRASRAHDQANAFFGRGGDFGLVQESASDWLRSVLESVREVVRGQKVRFYNEQIGLGIWAADHAAGTMTLLGLSDRAYTDERSLVSVPLELVSNWTSVETVTNGSARAQDPDVYASRWRYVRGLPLVIAAGEEGRTLVGALTLTSTKPRAKSVFDRTPDAVLDAIDDVLSEAGTLAFVD